MATCRWHVGVPFCVHRCGLVFFELFSGGKRPISELGKDPLEDSHQRSSADLFHIGPTDLNAMKIIDAIGDDDELFGGMGMDDRHQNLFHVPYQTSCPKISYFFRCRGTSSVSEGHKSPPRKNKICFWGY